jgi:hypothetical protein
MWWATPRVGADMQSNVTASERTPRLVAACAAGVAAALVPGVLLKSLFSLGAMAMLATVATGYCPINAALSDRDLEAPHWRTLKTYRVES